MTFYFQQKKMINAQNLTKVKTFVNDFVKMRIIQSLTFGFPHPPTPKPIFNSTMYIELKLTANYNYE